MFKSLFYVVNIKKKKINLSWDQNLFSYYAVFSLILELSSSTAARLSVSCRGLCYLSSHVIAIHLLRVTFYVMMNKGYYNEKRHVLKVVLCMS